MAKNGNSKSPAITVAGITFTADQVKSATVTIDGRDIYIGERETPPKPIGFHAVNHG